MRFGVKFLEEAVKNGRHFAVERRTVSPHGMALRHGKLILTRAAAVNDETNI